ncbi:MAG: GNAT family N-acetyltransferase, partial [Cytophagales bacterium]|nr:GNAT family N-acetyltransferase [Cytophagales bacterium]
YEPENKSIFIGYTFYGRKFWGTGFNSHVKKIMLDYAFDAVDKVQFHAPLIYEIQSNGFLYWDICKTWNVTAAAEKIFEPIIPMQELESPADVRNGFICSPFKRLIQRTIGFDIFCTLDIQFFN